MSTRFIVATAVAAVYTYATAGADPVGSAQVFAFTSGEAPWLDAPDIQPEREEPSE